MNGVWLNILSAELTVFAVIALGLGARRANLLTEEADASLLRLTINVLLPCLILSLVVGQERLRDPANIVLPPLLGFATMAGGVALARLAARWTGLVRPEQRRTFALSAGLYNYGYIPLPLIALVFAGTGLAEATLGVLLVFNIGVDLALWTVGIIVLTGDLKRDSWKRAINVPSITIVVALAINGIGLHEVWPSLTERVMPMIRLVGDATIPMGLLLIGATIADHLRRGAPGPHRRTIGVACALRLGVLPLLFLLAARYLPVSAELKRVIVVQAAMPAAVFPIILARHYRGDPAVALRVALSTSLLALVTAPLWIGWGLKLVGLAGQ